VIQTKLVNEQQAWNEEIKSEQENITIQSETLEDKEANMKNNLGILVEEERCTIEEMKRLMEMKVKIKVTEKELHTKHEKHIQDLNAYYL
jgi:hypothetical protein